MENKWLKGMSAYVNTRDSTGIRTRFDEFSFQEICGDLYKMLEGVWHRHNIICICLSGENIGLTNSDVVP